MNSEKVEYDVVIIGGGPAGLTAAFFLAKVGLKVIVFEQQKEKGLTNHPCGGMTAPVKNYINFKKKTDGIYYKESEFLFTNDMIIAYPTKMIFTVPNGSRFGMELTKNRNKTLIFQVDKQKVMKALADRAEKSGAILKFGSKVPKLIQENSIIKGVIVNKIEIRSKIVISAEGLSRKFSNEAGLFSTKPINYCLMYANYYKNIDLSEDLQGQISYFGNNYVNLPRSSISFHSYGHNKAFILISVFVDKFKWPYAKKISNYLDYSIEKIPFLTEIKKNGILFQKKGCWVVLQKPDTLINNGFIGIGDSVAPLGNSSISIGMVMGRDVALVCKKAIQKNDLTAKSLNRYNKYLNSKIFKGVEFEAKLILSMMEFTDEELNTLSRTLSGINLEPFMAGSTSQMLISSMKLIFKKRILKNWKMIKRLFIQ